MSRHSLLVAAILAASVLPAQAAQIQVSLTGLTDNTFVSSGDPCGTGLTGGNACNSQTIVINLLVDTGAAPADTNASATVGNYRVITGPGFISGSATLNGRTFTLPVATAVDHTIDVYDNVNGGAFGILDRVQFAVLGSNVGNTVSFSVTPNVLMAGATYAGDGLDLLDDIAGSPLVFNGLQSLSNGSFNFKNATGEVLGQYRLSSVAFSGSAVPAPPAVWLLGTAVAGLAARRFRG